MNVSNSKRFMMATAIPQFLRSTVLSMESQIEYQNILKSSFIHTIANVFFCMLSNVGWGHTIPVILEQ